MILSLTLRRCCAGDNPQLTSNSSHPKISLQAIWKFVLWPALFITIGFTVINNPDAAVNFVTGIILFSASHPVITSIAILFTFGLIITPYILPVVASAVLVTWLVDPTAFKKLLPPLPSVPKWLLPAPVRQVSPVYWGLDLYSCFLRRAFGALLLNWRLIHICQL
jgi:ABC-type sugar transport system permease subunit